MRRAWLLGLGLLGAASAAVIAVLLLTGGEQLERAGAASGCESGTAVPEPANNPGLVADCETLLALRDELRGTATLNWSAETSIRRWSGVLISGAPPRVTRIWLWSSSLSGRVSAGLGKLTALTSLDLHDNALSGAIPAELGSLTQLQTLHLNKNKLTGSIPAELEQLSQLQWVTLAGNTLEGCVPPKLRKVRFHDLPQLRLRDCVSTPSTATPTPTATPSSLPAVTIAAAATTVTEGQNASFTVSRTGSTSAALTVALSVGETGSTLSGTPPTSVTIPAGDASATLGVTTDDDSLDELDSVVTAALATGAGYTVGTPGSATVTVEDNDPAALPAVTITAVAASVTEGRPVRFTVNRTGVTAAALTVTLSVSETGKTFSGEPPASVTITAGAASAALDVATEDDAVDEPDSVVTATIAAGSGYTVGSPSSAMVTVEDDDATSSALPYNKLDKTGEAMTPGSYAFLATTGGGGGEGSPDAVREKAGASVSVITTWEGLRGDATGLRIHQTDANGVSRASTYAAVAVGDAFEWRHADDCWISYRVSKLMPDPPGPQPRKHFEVEPVGYAYTGCSGAITANTAVEEVWAEPPARGGASLTAPVVYGVFQVVPENWSGEIDLGWFSVPPSADSPDSADDWVNTASLAEARKLPYWRDLPGWIFERATSGGMGDPVYGYCARFRKDSPVHSAVAVCGWHAAAQGAPIETKDHFGATTEVRFVNGYPALVYYFPRTSPNWSEIAPVRLTVYDAAAQSFHEIAGWSGNLRGSNVEALLDVARTMFQR